MRDCPDETLRDSLPLYASGTLAAADRARVATHLASCADCSAELDVVRAVVRAYPAPKVNVAAVAARIPLRRAARKQVAFHRQPLWRMAAAITLFITGTATVMVVRGRGVETLAPISASTGSAAAETTLAAAGATSGPPATTVTTSNALLSLGTDMSDLTDAQLQSLLGSLDGIDSRPTADPTIIATPIIQDRTQAPGRSNQ